MTGAGLKNIILSLFMTGLVFSAQGCVYLVVGGVAAVGGYAISPDTVEGTIAGHNTQDVWQAAVDTISIMGIIEEKNDISGILIANTQGAHVTVSVSEPLTDNVKLRIKARKGIMPKVKLAQDIYNKIAQRVHP